MATTKICDGCGSAGKKGVPTYELTLAFGPEGHGAEKIVMMDVHPSADCVKKALRSYDADDLVSSSTGVAAQVAD